MSAIIDGLSQQLTAYLKVHALSLVFLLKGRIWTRRFLKIAVLSW